VLDSDRRAAIADELFAAHRDRNILPRLTARDPDMTVEDSYAVQSLWAQRRKDAGHAVAGHKIGLTSKAMQAATGITEPDYGVIFDDQVYASGSRVEFDAFSNVRIEVELAFALSKPLSGDGYTVDDVLDATDYVVPALEILNSHLELEGRTIVDTIADNAALGAMVVGDVRVAPGEIDLPWVCAVLERDGEIEETGVAAGVLGHPALGVAWLAGKLAQHGAGLGAGEIVLAGSFTRPMWVRRGDLVRAQYRAGERGMGEVTCRFE
jgi:2-oxo-hept-3-ene-1,7-dioate hydratase